MIPSQRVYQLLILGTVVGLAVDSWSHWFGLSIGLALLWDGLVLGLAVWDSRQTRPVTLTRLPLERLSIGRDNSVTLLIQTSDDAATLQIRDTYPPSFTAQPALLQLNDLPPNSHQEASYTVFPPQRGEYNWGAIHVRQRGRWGLAWRDWTIPQAQTVSVYPDLVGLRSLSLRLTLQTAGNVRRTQRLGMGTEFAELRSYSTGDDPRLIDWKATARRNQLLLRVLEPDRDQTLIILLDRGRLMTAQVQGLARFDWGLNGALALALAGLNRGDRVGMGVFDRQMHTWIPPERGQGHLAKLIDRLTPIQPVLLEPDYLTAVTTITAQQTRRALVVLISDVVDQTASAELLQAMGRLSPRYLPFCVTLRDPQVDVQAHTLSLDLAGSYQRAVALDLMAQRQVALATLKQRGVLILDVPAHQVTEQVVDRYLQLKARNLL